MGLISEDLENYCTNHTSEESELLIQLNRSTHLNILQPRMLSGHFQGRLLAMFSKMINPKRILEIGTYTGYSALCLAEGLTEDGKLISIDINEELGDFVNSIITKSKYKNNIECIIDDALKIIPQLEETFDIVFIDADKKNYINYYNLIFDKVNKGGYILADNILWSGKVVDNSKKDKDTALLREFNQMIQDDIRVENILLPIRDGLMVVRKI